MLFKTAFRIIIHEEEKVSGAVVGVRPLLATSS